MLRIPYRTVSCRIRLRRTALHRVSPYRVVRSTGVMLIPDILLLIVWGGPLEQIFACALPGSCLRMQHVRRPRAARSAPGSLVFRLGLSRNDDTRSVAIAPGVAVSPEAHAGQHPPRLRSRSMGLQPIADGVLCLRHGKVRSIHPTLVGMPMLTPYSQCCVV